MSGGSAGAVRCCVAMLALAVLAACEPRARGETEPADAAAEQELPADAARRELVDADAALRRAVAAADVEAAVALLAPNAELLFPETPPAPRAGAPPEGRGTYLGPGYERELHLGEAGVSAAGDLGWASGTYAVRAAGDPALPVREQGKYLTVWKRVDGAWRVAAATYTSDGAGTSP